MAQILPWAQLVGLMVTVVIAAMALRNSRGDSAYQQGIDSEKRTRDGAAQSALTVELAQKFEQLVGDMKAEAERFRAHDRDCIRDKTRMAEQIGQNTDNLKALTRVVNNLERRAGYVARDDAIADTREKLTGKA
jgi:hypothetical protein